MEIFGSEKNLEQWYADHEKERAHAEAPVCWMSLCTSPAYHRRMTYQPNGPGFNDVEKIAVMLCGDCARQFDNKTPDTDKFY